MFGSIPRKFPSLVSLRFGWVATRRDEKFTPLPVFEASCDFVTSVGSKQPTEATLRMIGIEIDDPGGTLELFKELTMGASAKLSLRSGWLLLLLLIGGCWITTVAYQAFTGITREQEKQLHDGMTKEDVIRVLGMLHGGETIDRDFWIYWTYPRTFDPLKLGFDEDGRLCSVSN